MTTIMATSQATNSLVGNFMQTFEYYYSRYWAENCDPRFNKSTLMHGGPWQMLTITLTYLTAVTLFGPYMMRKRKPMENLTWPIRVYNGFMVLFNAYLFINFSKKLNWGLDCWGCGKSMQLMDQAGIVLWELTLLSRYFDFFDSIFFICRKKFDHLSVLHVTHHTIVPVIVWFAGKFQATPMVVFAGYINLPIHVIMYSYYCLSTFPGLRKFLWWKKYLTSLQIAQFCLDLVHSLQVVYYPYCEYHSLSYVQAAFSVTFLYLFGQFYLRNYIKSKSGHSSSSSSSSKSTVTTTTNNNHSNGYSTRQDTNSNHKQISPAAAYEAKKVN